MADAGAAEGLSGHTVRAAVDAPGEPEAVAKASLNSLEETVRQAGDFALRALDLTGEAIGQAVDVASDKAFQSAATIGRGVASQSAQDMAQTTFSWTGYLQALGIMCILMAGLWFAVWAIRRYGKFNFLPRPGSLPKDSLVMEAQMPLGPRKGLMVVRFMNRRLLLGVTDQQISLLTEEKTDEPASFSGYMDDAAADQHSGRSGNFSA